MIKKNYNKKLFASVAIIFFLASIGVYCGKKTADSIVVKTVKIDQGPIYSIVRGTGRVTSGREAQVSTQFAGRIISVHSKEGQTVTAGQLLIRLDGREADAKVATAEAELRGTREKVTQTKREKENIQKVWQVGGASLQALKDAESNLEIAAAAEEKAVAELRSVNVMRESLSIRAPFNGLITKNAARIGEYAAPGAPLLTIADVRAREIEVMVDDADGGLVAAGQHVEVSSDAFPNKVWAERVVRVGPAVQKEGSANTIKVAVSVASNTRELRFGQQVDVKIRTASREHAMTVPIEALITQDGKVFVAVLQEGSVHMVPLVTGIESATHVEIVQGVQPGMEVILSEGKRLSEGQRAQKAQNAGVK